MNSYLIILILLLPLPLYVLYKKRFEKTKEGRKAYELKVAFYQLSRKHRLSIDEVEIFSNKIIGVDKNYGKLLWIEYVDEGFRQYCISLKEMKSHRVRKVFDIIDNSISRLVLEVNLRNQKPIYFHFYDSSKDNRAALKFLREKAKYWNAKIHFIVNSYNSLYKFEYVL